MTFHRSTIVLYAAIALLFAPHRVAAQPVGGEFQVNTYTSSDEIYPSVAFDGDGDFVVTWTDYRNLMSNDIFGQRFASSGAKVGSEFKINSNGTGATPQSQSAVAAESNGDFAVVWQSYQDGAQYGIFGQRFSSGGTALGSEFQINTYTLDTQFFPGLTMDDDGDFVVVWQSYNQDGPGSGVYAQRYASSGAALGGEFRVNTHTENTQILAAVASDSDGDFVVAWSSLYQEGLYFGIFGQRYASSGAALGTEFQINTYTLNTQFAPSVAAENNGDFVVVWVSYGQDGSGSGVFGQRFASSGAKVGSEFQVNTHTVLYQRFASVASDRNGGFEVVWESLVQDGSSYGVFGQRFANNGDAVGGEFQINTFTEDRQERPALAAADDGQFVVAWHSKYQDGAARGIFAQRYAALPVCPATPDPGCVTGFGKGLFLIKENVAGKEKLIAKLLKGPATTQADLGNPLSPGGTSYALCVYGDTTHVATLEVDRAGDATCSGGATDCWAPIGDAPPDGKGYKYKDDDLAAGGVAQIQLKAGTTKIIVKGKGATLPLPIASQLTAATSVTLQVRGSDTAQCYGVTLSDIKKQETDAFKVK